MEVLERIGDVLSFIFGGLARMIERSVTAVFGSANARYLKRLNAKVAQINALEERYKSMSDEELRAQTVKFRERLAAGETLDDILPEAFAVCREGGRRWLNMRHYDVQLIGGMVLHYGNIAEMITGEGKTLVATLPAYLNALEGRGVHVITVNDYLARRDMEWMGPLYMNLGLTVGAIYADMPALDRQKAYDSDITYGTNNEFGFDYLRDNMKPAARGSRMYPPQMQQAQRELNFAIIDEVDNILIDEARTPLIISGKAHDDVGKYAQADRIARMLQRDVHFEVKEKEHTCHMTDEGVRAAEKLAGVESFYTAGNMEWPHLIDNSLKAHHLYKRDVNYVVEDGEVVIVDEFTGRKMPGRQWSDGLHQSVEAKEGVRIKEETQTMATITLQNFFKLYNKLAGMTGTAMTEANEFWKIYQLDVIAIPTNRSLQRINYPDVIYRTEREKFEAIAEEIERMNKWDVLELNNGSEIWGRIQSSDDTQVEILPKDSKTRQTVARSQIRATSRQGRPILIGTVSIEKSERLAELLARRGIPHEVLNAKNHKREAEIIAQAGRKHAVTIATNMAGRGTDIILGGNPETMAWAQLQSKYATRLDVPKEEWESLVREISEREKMKEIGREVAGMGGLHVIGTERHESRRIDNQLRGRCGRQGDPGSSRFYLSLEDDLMRIFAGEWVKNVLTKLGMQEGEAIESRMVSRRIEGAQKKVEEMHFDRRKNLLEYDEVMDEQRKRVYGLRQQILTGHSTKKLLLEMVDKQLDQNLDLFLDRDYGPGSYASWAAGRLGFDPPDARDFRDMDSEAAASFARDEAESVLTNQIQDLIDENLSEDVEPEEWNWEALAKAANTRWKVSQPAREFKRIGRDSLFDYLYERAVENIRRTDLSEGARFLDPMYGLQNLADWVKRQFSLEIDPQSLKQLERQEVRARIRELIDSAWRQKEVEYPVMSGLMARLEHGANQPGATQELAAWAQHRFGAALQPEDFKSRQRDELLSVLMSASRRRLEEGAQVESEVRRRVEKLFVDGADSEQTAGAASSNGALISFSDWLEQNLGGKFPPDTLAGMRQDDLQKFVQEAVDERFQPELRHLERFVLLEHLDSAWKDHLLAMDHLRQSVGMRGYAQVDPKVEYKREGMRLFEAMWKSIGDRTVEHFFHIEQLGPGDLPATFGPTQAVKQDAAPTSEIAQQQEQAIAASGGGERRMEPIRNRNEHVGRNDPCPCGSGKKFKNCCMRRTTMV